VAVPAFLCDRVDVQGRLRSCGHPHAAGSRAGLPLHRAPDPGLWNGAYSRQSHSRAHGNVGTHLWSGRADPGIVVLVFGRSRRAGAYDSSRARRPDYVRFVPADDLRIDAAGQARLVSLSIVIEVQNLTHRYGNRVALSGVSFAVRKGEI